MLKNFVSQQEFQDETFEPNRIPEKRKRGRPRAVIKGEGIKQSPDKSIPIDNMQELHSINKNESPPLEDYLWKLTENMLYPKKNENQSDEDEKNILDVMPNQASANSDAMEVDKTPREYSKDGSDLQEHDPDGGLDSNFDSPYDGDDKFRLDILEEERHPNQEYQSVEDDKSFNKKGFAILDKNFTFGNDDSLSLQKKNTFDDLSSWDAFDHFDIDLPERKIENNAKEHMITADKLFLREGEASHQLFEDLRIPSFTNLDDMDNLNNLDKENRRGSLHNKSIEAMLSHRSHKMEEEYGRNLSSGEKIIGEENEESDNIFSLFPDKYRNLKENAKSYNRVDFIDAIDETDKLSALDAMIKKLVKSNNMEVGDLSMMEKCYKNDDEYHIARHFEEVPQTLASRETMSSIGESLTKHNRKIRKLQNKDKSGNPDDFDINKLRHRIQEKKVYKLIRVRKPTEESHEEGNSIKAMQSENNIRGRKKTSVDDSLAENSEESEINERRFKGAGDELDRVFAGKIKKKIKHDGPKSTTSELDRKQSDSSISKKGITSTKDNKKSDIFHNDFPRRSLREKREPQKQSYDKKIDDFGFTFVEYKSYKPQKIKVIISFKALLMMNIHAHLTTLEVIGILGGVVVSEDEIWIKEAVPCKNISESSNTHSVEMDPTSQVESQEQLERMGYKSLGWYHSHPTFRSIPSQIDQETHLAHQIHYKDHHYIGVIIGPYEKPASKKGEMFVFHVAGTQTYKLNFIIQPTQSLSQYDIDEIGKIIYDYKKSDKIIKFQEKWKKGTSYQEKIMSCVRTLLEENFEDLQLNPGKSENSPISAENNNNDNNDNNHLVQTCPLDEESKKNEIPIDSRTPIENFLRSFETLLQ